MPLPRRVTGGGATDPANLVLRCRAHHRAVHEGGWTLSGAAEAVLVATGPHGRRLVGGPVATGDRVGTGGVVAGGP